MVGLKMFLLAFLFVQCTGRDARDVVQLESEALSKLLLAFNPSCAGNACSFPGTRLRTAQITANLDDVKEKLAEKKKEAQAKRAAFEVKKRDRVKTFVKEIVKPSSDEPVRKRDRVKNAFEEATKPADEMKAAKPVEEEKVVAVAPVEEKKVAVAPVEEKKVVAVAPVEENKTVAVAPVEEKETVAAGGATRLRKRDRVKNFFKNMFGTKEEKQDFLEFEPYYDTKTMPDNTYKPKSPFEGKIISVKRIVGAAATGETCDIVIDHGGKMPYIEGQSYGVIPPGVNPKNGKPNKVRLYSIASSRYGDDMKGTTTTLCVRRATYWCPELKADDPAKKGVCSNYLCDAKCGDAVKLTGPSGKVMLLPESKPETDIIMVATGTGIAPYRSFLKRMFVENTPFSKDFKGIAWLFLGVANSDALLYDDDWKSIKEKYPDQFRYDVALSREQTNKDGGKMYIQDKVEEYADEIFDRLEKGAHIYFCGLKGMMPGIQTMLEKVATAKDLDYQEFIKKLKKNGQWHVEVY